MIFPTEKQFQAAAFKCLNNEYHQFRGLVWHTKNEGKKNMAEAMQDKSLGLRAGIPDLILPLNGICFLNELKVCTPEELIKIKAEKINPFTFLNDSQKEFHPLWNKLNPDNKIVISFPDGSDGLLQIRQWADRIIKNNWRIAFQ